MNGIPEGSFYFIGTLQFSKITCRFDPPQHFSSFVPSSFCFHLLPNILGHHPPPSPPVPPAGPISNMKIAIIGGNLLGCATALNLALADEAGKKRGTPVSSSDESDLQITLFERSDRLGGNSMKSVRIDDHLSVEVGTYRTLPLVAGTHLRELVDIVNDDKETLSILGKRIKMPGSSFLRRGRGNAVPVKSLWESGSYKRVVRSFGLWDWEENKYNFKHCGWTIIDWTHIFLDNAIWRSIALAAFFMSCRKLNETDGYLARGIALAQVMIMLVLVIISPKKVIASWQKQYSFWATTILLLYNYGITPAIARGATIGFTRLLSDIKQNKIALLATSIASFVHRCGFENYLRGTGDDFIRIFKYNHKFTYRFLASTIGVSNNGCPMSQLSSLATQFSLLDGDEFNSDASTRIATLSPHNASLCPALIAAARASTAVDLRYNSNVKLVKFQSRQCNYILTLSDDKTEQFDGIILCASPMDADELKIENTLNSTIQELLGYTKNQESEEKFNRQEELYRCENGIEESKTPVGRYACSHIAVITGHINASFFSFAHDKNVPDLVQINNAPGFSRVERIRASSKQNDDDVYTVICGSAFESDGIFKEMFHQGSHIRYYEKIPIPKYSTSAFPEGMTVDQCCPPIVLGPKFIYAAALECLAKHPEMDAIAAANAASFFSHKIKWSAEAAEDDNNEEEGEEGDDGIDEEDEEDEDSDEVNENRVLKES